MAQPASWASVKSASALYRRRTPTDSPLYRIAYNERQNLEHHWEQLFEQEYGCLRHEVLDSLDAFLNCGIIAHGCARILCDTCNHSELLAFSCKKRAVCPSCDTKRALIFAEHLHQEILKDVPHRHVIFSIPKRLRPFFKFNRSLCSILFGSAWKTLKILYTETSPGIPGTILTNQTSGESLNFNPHLHGITSAGTFTDDGAFHPVPYIPTELLSKLFAHHVLSALLKKELISDTDVEQILSQNHTGFNVWMGDVISSYDDSFRLFLARYIDRGPVAASRISIDGSTITYYTEKDPKTYEFSPLEFLARLTPHIPDKWEQTTRYYGAYSSRYRARQKLQTPTTTTPQSPIPPLTFEPHQVRKASKTWAALIKKIYEVDPLVCPKCKGTMRIAAFITDSSEVARISKSLGIPKFSPPAPFDAMAPPSVFPEMD